MAELDDAYAWLLGPRDAAGQAALQPAGAAQGAAGILQRLFESITGDPCGQHEQIDVGAAVKQLHVPDLALACTVSVEVQSIRLRTDGTAPTAGIGLLIPAGTLFVLTGRRTMQAAQIIGAAAGAFIDVAYWS